MEFIVKAFVVLIIIMFGLMYLYTRPLTTRRRNRRR